MLKNVISLKDVFCLDEQRAVDTKDYLSHLCKDNVRTGKFFLCYCKSV